MDVERSEAEDRALAYNPATCTVVGCLLCRMAEVEAQNREREALLRADQERLNSGSTAKSPAGKRVATTPEGRTTKKQKLDATTQEIQDFIDKTNAEYERVHVLLQLGWKLSLNLTLEFLV